MTGTNEAYDLSLFQKREPRIVALKDNKKAVADKKRRARRQATLNVAAYLTLAILAIGIIGFFITCNVRLTEMNKAIADSQTQLSTLQSEKVRLETELAGKTSAGEIDRYALENGMVPTERSQIYYITAQEADLVKLPQQENWLKQLWAKFCGLFSSTEP